MGRILCGTCAWADHEDFYPSKVKPNERLCGEMGAADAGGFHF